MAYKKATVKTFGEVIEKVKNNFTESNLEVKKMWAESLNEWLDNLLGEDFFGTEGQLDPRGDHRE